MPSLRCWNVLSWNIRGLNSEKKRLALNNAIISSGCVIVCLQETKLCDVTSAFVKTCCPRQFDQFAFVPSRGASGGILIIWKSSVFSGTVVANDTHALVTTFVSTQSSRSWTLANIYGPCTGEERDIFTNWLYDVSIPTGQDWLFLGDFNYMRAPDNRNKPGGNMQAMLTFNDIIHK
jgi:exonuclease III